MSDIENIIRCLSVGGAVNICLDGGGRFQVSYKTKDRSAWHCKHGNSPGEALANAATSVRDDELPGYDVLEAAADRRAAVAEREAAFDRIKSLPAPVIDGEARLAVEESNAFEDLLG